MRRHALWAASHASARPSSPSIGPRAPPDQHPLELGSKAKRLNTKRPCALVVSSGSFQAEQADIASHQFADEVDQVP